MRGRPIDTLQKRGATALQQKGNLFSNNNVSLISLHTAVDSCSDLIIGMW